MKPRINLLDEIIRRARPPAARWTVLGVVGIGLVIPILVWVLQVRAARLIDPQIVELRTTRDRLVQEVAQARQTLENPGVPEHQPLEPVERAGVQWSEVLRELSLVVPEGVWLIQFEEAGAQGRPGGEAGLPLRIRGTAASQGGVAALLANLESAGPFVMPTLVYAQRETDRSRVEFEIQCLLQPPSLPHDAGDRT